MENVLPHTFTGHFFRCTLLLDYYFWIWTDICWLCKYKRWSQLCDRTWCPAGVLLEITIRRWVHCDHKDMDMIRNNTRVGCDIKQWSFGTKGHYVRQKRISPSSLHNRQQPDQLLHGRTNRWFCAFFFFCFVFFTPNSDPAIQMLQWRLILPGNTFQSCIVQWV